MGTKFLDIYEKMDIIRDDNRIRNKRTNDIYRLYYDYLSFAIAQFYRTCKKVSSKDLIHNNPFTQIEYGFISDGTDTDYILSTLPLDNGLFYVGYSQDTDTSFTEIPSDKYGYDELTNTITITGITIPENYIVYISSYQIGEFNETLDLDEISILANGSLIPYLQEQQNRTSLMTQYVFGGSMNMFSQSQHLSSVRITVSTQEDKVQNMITRYSYLASTNNLKGLGGVTT